MLTGKSTTPRPSEVKSSASRVDPRGVQLPVHTQIHSSSSEEWCDVNAVKDQKEFVESVQPASFSLIKGAIRHLISGRRTGLNPFHRKMNRSGRGTNHSLGQPVGNNFWSDVSERFTASGSSGAAVAPVFTLQPNSSSLTTEAALFASLFDEARCVGLTIHTRVSYNGTTNASAGAAWQFAYDPANSGAFTSVVGVGMSENNTGPIAGNLPSGSTIAETRSGYLVMRIKVPKPLAATAGAPIANETVGSAWFSTTDQSANCGFWKGYSDAIASIIATADVLVYYHMEYRNRT